MIADSRISKRSIRLLLALFLVASKQCCGFATTRKGIRGGSIGVQKIAGSGIFPLQATRSEPKEGEAKTFASTAITPIKRQDFVLGSEKVVSIYVPPDQLSPDASVEERSSTTNCVARQTLMDAHGPYRGRGDVVWPSSLQLSRLIANFPSFVANRKVLDLGCGLGLASLATILGNPNRLILSDIDDVVLDLAERSCMETIDETKESASVLRTVEKMKLDWSNPSTWPSEEVDVILASDILCDEDASKDVAMLISHILLHPSSSNEAGDDDDDDDDTITKRAIIVDPINRENRDSFVNHAARYGLMAQATPFPGQEDGFVLINVIPNEEEEA